MCASEYEEFIQRRAGRLMAIAYLLTGSRADAEDLAQETWYQLQRHWDKVQTANNIDAYSTRVLLNVFRSASRRKRLRIVGFSESGREHATLASDMDRVVEVDSLRRALDELPTRQRVAVVLRYFEDLDNYEIAEIMHVGESSVRSALSRGLMNLRRTLDVQQTEGSHAVI